MVWKEKKKTREEKEYRAKNKEKAGAVMLIREQRLRCAVVEPERETADTNGC